MWVGLTVTLKLSVVIWGCGLLLGPLLGIAGARWKFWVGGPSRALSVVFAALPALVFLFWLHYPLQAMLNVVIDPFITAATALSILNIVMVAEICRGAIIDFPHQYVMSAQVCGLSGRETTLKIKLPILFRQILPSLLIVQMTMMQATLFASLISVPEIFRVAQRINSLIYKPVEIYTLLALFFIAVGVPVHLFAHYLKNKYTRNLSEN